MKKLFIATMLLSLLGFTGCKTTVYSAKEKFGIQKRDILVGRVEDVVNVQQSATETFKTALERFSDVVDYEGGDLEKMYNSLNKELKKSQSKASEVNSRIAKVEQVSKDLFKEWKKELKEYNDPALRRSSEQQMKQTQAKTSDLIRTMKTTAANMDPVLARFSDQVLYLKHNLNAQALAGIRGEAAKVENDVTALISSMEASIAEAEAFIREMK